MGLTDHLCETLETRRLLAGGVDAMFGRSGMLSLSFARSGIAETAVTQPDGRILIAGTTWKGDKDDIRIVRLNPDGRNDRAFGKGGAVKLNLADYEAVFDLAVQQDGKILVLAMAGNDAGWSIVLLRLDDRGTPDRSFGDKGIAATRLDHAPGHVLLQADGGILVGGTVEGEDGATDFAVERFDGQGQVDEAFGINGLAMVRFGTANVSSLGGMQLVQEGILLSGTTEQSSAAASPRGFAVAKLTSAGALDETFGTAGLALAMPATNPELVFGGEVVVLNSGKLLLYGSVWSSASERRTLVRLTAQGVLDGVFGAGGFMYRDDVSYIADGGDQITLQPDGKVLLLSERPIANPGDNASDILVQRLDANGLPDVSFANSGDWRLDFDENDTPLTALVGPDGALTVVGASWGRKRDAVSVSRYQESTLIGVTMETTGRLVVRGTAGADKISVSSGKKCVSVSFNGRKASFTASQVSSIRIFGGDGNDKIALKSSVLAGEIDGDDGDDIITGGNLADTLTGGAGNDLIKGGNGSDRIDGGAGNDRLYGLGGDDVLLGFDEEADFIDGGKGEDLASADALLDLLKNVEGDGQG